MSRQTAVLGILEALSTAPRHGHAIATDHTIAPRTRPHGQIYPLLHRLEQAGWIVGHWHQHPEASSRRIKYYALGPIGRRVLARAKGRRTDRSHVWGVAALACGMSATVAAQDSATGPRVRSTSPLIRDLLTRGAVQSPTFRRLLTAINETDGIVYVENGHCGHGVHNCLLFSITPAGGFRYLRILIDTSRFDHPERSNDLVASMAHELRHAFEVLTEPNVRTTIDMFSLYANQAGARDGRFETDAAVRTGDRVLNEMTSAPAAVPVPHRFQ